MAGQEQCFIMLCTNRTERECLDRALFGDRASRLQYLEEIRFGDVGLLLNVSSNELIGVFTSCSEAQVDIEPDAWGGKFRAQVQVILEGTLKRVKEAGTVLADAGVSLIDLPSGALIPIYPVHEKDITRRLLNYFER